MVQKFGLVTDILKDYSFEEMLDLCVELGIESVELGCGNWSSAPHVNLDELLQDASKRKQFYNEINARGLSIAALNCSGNQLFPGEKGEQQHRVIEKTIQLAELLEVKTVVMMSGCPGGSPQDITPNWIAQPFLPEHHEILRYQWEDVFLPYWHNLAKKLESHGVRAAIENHGYNLAYNPDTVVRLRNAVGNSVGINLDPSHLIWMGGDPIAAVRFCKDAIHHVHAKDVRIEYGIADAHGLLETRPIEEVLTRAWNYVAVGYGKDEGWWKEFFVTLSMVGYDGPIVLEMEDLTMPPLMGVEKSVDALKRVTLQQRIQAPVVERIK